MKPSDSSGHKPANNPFHVAPVAHQVPSDDTDALASFSEGLSHELEDLVKLELAAEQMLGEEVDLARAYINEDTQGVWSELKAELYQWELVAGDWLLSAADPTRVDWQVHHWWGDDETHLH